jgi:hypothetical protein
LVEDEDTKRGLAFEEMGSGLEAVGMNILDGLLVFRLW